MYKPISSDPRQLPQIEYSKSHLYFSFFSFFAIAFLETELNSVAQDGLNVLSYCFSLPRAGVTGACRHT